MEIKRNQNYYPMVAKSTSPPPVKKRHELAVVEIHGYEEPREVKRPQRYHQIASKPSLPIAVVAEDKSGSTNIPKEVKRNQGYSIYGSLPAAIIFGLASFCMGGFTLQSLIIGAVMGAICEPLLHGGPKELKIGDIVEGNFKGKTLIPDKRVIPYMKKSESLIIDELEEKINKLEKKLLTK